MRESNQLPAPEFLRRRGIPAGPRLERGRRRPVRQAAAWAKAANRTHQHQDFSSAPPRRARSGHAFAPGLTSRQVHELFTALRSARLFLAPEGKPYCRGGGVTPRVLDRGVSEMGGRILLFIHRHFFATLALLAAGTLTLAVLR